MSLVNLRTSTRADVLAYFRNTWELTNTLFSALATDASFYMLPDKIRRPLIFYFGHPAALYINKMHQAGLVDHVNPFFQKLFETGVDEMSWDDMDAMQVRLRKWGRYRPPPLHSLIALHATHTMHPPYPHPTPPHTV